MLNNVGLGAQAGTLEFIENTHTDMSSFREPDQAWGEVSRRIPVSVTTIDRYCAENRISYIDLLKIDTQGYEYEVLTGANAMLSAGNVSVVLTELNCTGLYKGVTRYDKLLADLADHGYWPVRFYNQNIINGALAWADVVLVRESFEGRLAMPGEWGPLRSRHLV
jgi:hypothetical protein